LIKYRRGRVADFVCSQLLRNRIGSPGECVAKDNKSKASSENDSDQSDSDDDESSDNDNSYDSKSGTIDELPSVNPPERVVLYNATSYSELTPSYLIEYQTGYQVNPCEHVRLDL
jgi:hypothetical protein